MSDLVKCRSCNGRGYHRCSCWPGDCICGWDDADCEECSGSGWIEPDQDGDWWEEWPDDAVKEERG